MANNDSAKRRVAIVGFDCRLPEADTVDEFWKNLLAEKESMTEFSEEQLLASGISPTTFNNPHYVRNRGIIKGVDQFDAEFFNFTPREAELLDPQQRLFLECAWHALEDSGIDPFNTQKKIAVLGGVGSPYHFADAIHDKNVQKFANGTAIVTSNDKDYVATRVSYKLNLTGPSVNIQCACSTSMVSVVLGIDSLLNYQSDIVLAGGSSVELTENQGYMYQPGGLESPDGKCRSFDKDAAGTAFSRGCGVVALKRLEDALADKDHIYAVILGGAINNDGNRKAGFTAPSVQGQVEVITEAIELAGIDPTTITMVEAHGTSTPVGDPIEVASLTEAFGQYTTKKGYCALGSVKTNIGHTDVASGIASLIKAALSVKHGIIPASLNFHEPNPAINFADSPFFVNTRTTKWDRHGAPARALINSFGVGGTNACVILEEAPPLENAPPQHDHDLLFISAHHKDSFKKYCENIHIFLEDHPETNLNGLAHTSRTGRRPLKYKGAIAFRDREDLLAKLSAGLSPANSKTAADKGLVWMFSGQGNQFVNMGKELFTENRIFQETVDYCATLLQPIIGLDIREVMYPNKQHYDEAVALISRTYITQPAIFIVSYAIARVFQSYGITPDALIGHSVGEYVAAALSGVMTIDDSLKAVALRGKLVYDLPEGSMLAVLLSEAELAPILPAELDIAVINSPELVVVSGATADIESFAAQLKKKRIVSKKLPTSHAFHSRMMTPCLHQFRDFFKEVSLHAPVIPIISTVTGQLLSGEQAQDHEYWVQHLVKPVLFGKAAAQKLSSTSAMVFLECGPGQSLESAVKRRLKPEDLHAAIGTLHENEKAVTALDTALGKLWIEGITFDYDLRFNSSGYQKVSYPLLPFNRKKYKLDFTGKDSAAPAQANVKKENIGDWFYIPSWKRTAPIDLVPKNKKETSPLPVKWLVFSENTFADTIARRIREKGMDCMIVKPGDHYQEINEDVHIRIDEKDDYRQLISAASHDDRQLCIIHAWNLTMPEEETISVHNAAKFLDRYFYSLIYLEQGLISNNLGGQVSLTCLVNDAFNVTGGVRIRPEKSLSIGPIRVLFKEHPEMRSKLVNLETASLAPDYSEKIIDQLIKETEIETDETIITYSGTDRWTEIIEPVSLRDEQENLKEALKENGVYLITGGSGGIGRTLSLLLAETVKCTLIWTGRRTLPTRQDWERLIQNDDTDLNLKDILGTILQIEQMGSAVQHLSVEVSDVEGMNKMVAEVEAACGSINGIIHSAGTAGGGVVAFMEREDAKKVLEAKVAGALVLQSIFADKALDFVYLFSSITAILGEAGRVDYTSGNAFMDALSHTQFLRECKTVCSVNWGSWGVVGMAADWQRDKNKKKSKGKSQKEKMLPASEDSSPIALYFQSAQGKQEFYSVNVNAKEHWVLNEHLLSGVPTLVGTTFLDLLTKWKYLKGIGGEMIIHDGVFLSPMMIINNAPTDLQLVCEQTGSETYSFLFRSSSGASEKTWKDHFSGTVSIQNSDQSDKTVDIAVLIQQFTTPPDTSRHFTIVRDGRNKVMLQYSSRWDCKEKTYISDDACLSQLELPQPLAQDLDCFQIHPAMLDVATSTHVMHMIEKRGVYLPFSYGAVQIHKSFPRTLYSHAKRSRPLAPDDQYIYFDINLYDENGEAVLSIKEYAFIKVGETTEGSQADNTDKLELKHVFEEDDILPDEGKHVFKMLLQNPDLPQVTVYTKDLVVDFIESKISYVRKNLLKKKQKAVEMVDVDDRPDIDTPYEQPDNEIEKSIAAIWSSILGINKLGANDSFIELGGNSLLTIQVISGIGEEFGVEIEANEFIKHATIRSQSELVLTKILEGHEGSDIENLLNAESI
jgi:phthiocerol/phenolphthiocerol synthesis type-I polyketide synthase E